MSSPYIMPIEIGFKHCDPAGIVFYPRYVEMINDTVEHWFKYGLRAGFASLHGERKIAVPTANLQCDFKAPSRLGEQLNAALSVAKLGRSSLSLDVVLSGAEPAGTLRMSAKLVIVCVDMDGLKPIEIPADIRAAAGRYQA